MDTDELKHLRTKLKQDEYNGVDIMHAWIAIDELVELRKWRDRAFLIAAAPKLLDIAQRLGVYLPAELQPEVDAVIAEALGHGG